ncbi:MAG: methionyl-tRNA formyltransferase, partial [Candidatus Latescibacterota bacterium]
QWSDSAEAVARQIRAMSPWPTAYTSYRGKRLIVLDGIASASSHRGAKPGTIVSTSPLLVAAGEGTLEVSRVKVEGKKEMPASAFVAGYRVTTGDSLG